MIQILHSIKDYLSLTKPRVVILLQITAICSVIIHDSIEGDFGSDSIQTMLVVLIGGYLTAGGANAINMWYDRDIDPKMARTSGRAIPSGRVEAGSALFFGILISILGVWWFYEMSNEVAAFWSAFSVLFYVLIYSIWLKRRTAEHRNWRNCWFDPPSNWMVRFVGGPVYLNRFNGFCTRVGD